MDEYANSKLTFGKGLCAKLNVCHLFIHSHGIKSFHVKRFKWALDLKKRRTATRTWKESLLDLICPSVSKIFRVYLSYLIAGWLAYHLWRNFHSGRTSWNLKEKYCERQENLDKAIWIFYLMNIYYKISLQIKPPEINILSLMPDEKKIFGGFLVLDFRKWWRHVKTIYLLLLSCTQDIT